MRLPRLCIAAIVVITLCSTSTRAQDFKESFALISRNHSFESGLGGWSKVNLAVALKSRSVPDGFLGAKYVNLKGAGTWVQSLAIPTGSKRYLLNAFAYKAATQGTGPGGDASIIVSYFDSQFNLLDAISIPIGEYWIYADGFKQYSSGIEVPVGATHLTLSVICSEGTEVNIDNFGVFDYKLINQRPVTPSLIARPQLSNFFSGGNSGAVGYGTEFWETDFDVDSGIDGLIGSRIKTSQRISLFKFNLAKCTRSMRSWISLVRTSQPSTALISTMLIGTRLSISKWRSMMA